MATNEWPSGVTNKAVESGIPPGVPISSGCDSTVSELVSEIKPRYHIAGTMGVFYAREPYYNIGVSHVTRFLGLAPVGNKDKQKFLHAISPTPAAIMSAVEISKKPSNTSLSPYIDVEKISQAEVDVKRPAESDTQYWRYDVPQKRQKTGSGDAERRCFKYVSSGSCPRGDKCHFLHDDDAREQYLRGVCFDFINKGKCEKGPDCSFKHSLQDTAEELPNRKTGNANVHRSKECWFCLSSPNIESHLIISVGDSFYCALPKGPLLEDHVLLVPIEHAPNTISMPLESEIELQKFQSSLKAYYKDQDKEAVFFEWIYRRGTHANLQAVPVPSSRASSVKDIFILAAKKLGFEFVVTKSRELLRAQFDANVSLFYVELPCGTILSHTVDENEKFPAQFGREVLAGLLNMADKADWRKCAPSKEEEMAIASGFKKKFETINHVQHKPCGVFDSSTFGSKSSSSCLAHVEAFSSTVAKAKPSWAPPAKGGKHLLRGEESTSGEGREAPPVKGGNSSPNIDGNDALWGD
ncbi:unnamed protein product [Rhodiola kirilowii]